MSLSLNRKALAGSTMRRQEGNADLTQLGETLLVVPTDSLKFHSSRKRRFDNYFSELNIVR